MGTRSQIVEGFEETLKLLNLRVEALGGFIEVWGLVRGTFKKNRWLSWI